MENLFLKINLAILFEIDTCNVKNIYLNNNKKNRSKMRRVITQRAPIAMFSGSTLCNGRYRYVTYFGDLCESHPARKVSSEYARMTIADAICDCTRGRALRRWFSFAESIAWRNSTEYMYRFAVQFWNMAKLSLFF